MKRKALETGRDLEPSMRFDSLQDILPYLAECCPGRGITYIDASGNEEFVSYPQMLEQSQGWLGALQERGIKPGDRVLAEIIEPKDYHRLFWACVFGGFAIAPMGQPASWADGSEAMRAMNKIWAKLDKPVVITQAAHAERYGELKNREAFEGLRHVAVEELAGHSPGARHAAMPDDIAYIQFSSGTTGDQKGAMLSYENIRGMCEPSTAIMDVGEDDVGFSWLPHTHNLGVFVPIVMAMMQKHNMYFMLPSTYMRNPYLFLKKLSDHKGAWFCSNNFGLDWMSSQIPDSALGTLDLSSLKWIYAGGENVSMDVIDRFAKKFAPCGMRGIAVRPGYGLTEATLTVSLTPANAGVSVEVISRKELMCGGRAVPADPADPDDCLSLTGNGVPVGGVTIRIADDGGETVDERVVGEVSIKGVGVYKGYYGSGGGTPADVRDGWLRTGDLGYFSDGTLYIVGRKKDVAVFRGANYMMTDLEDLIYRKTSIPRGRLAVASVMNTLEHQEEMIVFVVHKGSLEEFLPIRQSIMDAVNDDMALGLRLVIPVEALSMTASGKVRRQYMKLQFESSHYSALSEQILRMADEEAARKAVVEPQNEAQEAIRECWSKALRLDAEKISIDDAFTSLGGGSVQAYWLLGMLSKEFGRELDHEIIVTCRTIREMARYLDDAEERSAGGGAFAACGSAPGEGGQIAITGMAFRLPQARTQDEFWANLCEKKSAIAKVSENRRGLAGEPEWDDWIGEVEGIDSFDYGFFGMTEDEAVFSDPQQRILLELAYEALADAGMLADGSEDEKQIGVYTGVGVNSYYPMILDYLRKHGVSQANPKTLIGNIPNITSAQISHQYNFTGPVMAIDTACSSFMTALHYAAKAISEGEVAGAMVAGSNIMPSKYFGIFSSKAGIISSTNRSKVFDKDADGSLLGEGAVTVFLEPLQSAVVKNKNIYGVLCGSAVNNDGFALSVMAPNPKGQHEVLKQAYGKAGIDPDDISYFEAHGTGTVIGDPIELSALSKLYGDGARSGEKDKIGIGSVKTNIGHLLWASGGAGLVKVLLCLKNKTLVPSLNMEDVNPLLEIEKTPFRIITETEKWDAPSGKKRLAGITSLGLGGTNAHVVISEWEAPPAKAEPGRAHLLALSAKTEAALDRVVKQTEEFIEKAGGDQVGNLCFTLNRYRKHYGHRAACVVAEGVAALPAVERGVKEKSVPAKVCVALGDLRKDGTLEEFREWEKFLVQLQDSVKGISFIGGEKSGTVFCDMLNGRVGAEEASRIYCKGAGYKKWRTEEHGLRVVPDVMVYIGSQEDFEAEADGKEVVVVPAGLGAPDGRMLPELMKKLYLLGAEFKWDEVHPDGSGRIINLPAYPFERNSLWIRNRGSSSL